MREILFRGKNAKGEWEYGVPLITGLNSEIAYITQANSYDCRVDIETVGQYTGLTDKNGKKIFEGDIVKAHFKNNRSIQTFKVGFLDGMFIFDNNCVKVNFWDIYCLEIVGNIHDNPELLKGENNG